MRRLSCLLLACGLMFSLATPVQAQDRQSRFGLGLQILGSTAGNNLGPGLHFRASTPLNHDISLAVGSGLTGFIFRGRDDAAFALDPKVSAIVTVSTQSEQSTYALGSIGAYVPFGDTNTDSGPTFSLGVGRAWLLRESSVFFEFSPGLLVGEETTTLVVPLRIGLIL